MSGIDIDQIIKNVSANEEFAELLNKAKKPGKKIFVSDNRLFTVGAVADNYSPAGIGVCIKLGCK